MESAPQKLPNSLKSEHLLKGENPIIVCLGLPEDIDIQDKIRQLSLRKEVSGVNFVDYLAPAEVLKQEGFKNAGDYTYVISALDVKDKFSDWLSNCIGLIAVGRDKDTHENISFASHQNPEEFLKVASTRGKFETDIRDSLAELKKRLVLNQLLLVDLKL